MTQNNHEHDKNNDAFSKSEIILVNVFIILLIAGLLVAGIVLMKMSY